MRTPVLSRIGQPHFLSCIRLFQPSVLTTRILGPVDRQTSLDHFGGQVTAISEIASRDSSTVSVLLKNFCPHDLILAERYQLPFCLLTERMVQLRRINTEKSDLHFLDNDRISIDHVGFAPDSRTACDASRACWIEMRRTPARFGWPPRGGTLCVSRRPTGAAFYKKADTCNDDDDYEDFQRLRTNLPLCRCWLSFR